MHDHYSKYGSQDLWTIKEFGFNQDIQNIREAQFSLGNGLLGTRGVLEENPQGAMPGTYIAGIYDRLTSQVAELVNFPNPFFFKFIVKGEKFGAVAMDVLDHQRVLNMRDGVLIRRTVYSDSRNRRFDYQSIRFLSMYDKNIGVMQMVLMPLDDDAQIELQTGIDVSVYNSGTITEGVKRHFYAFELAQEDHSEFRIFETLEKHQKIIYRTGFYYQIGKKKVFSQNNVLTLKLKKKQMAIFTRIFYICPIGEGEDRLKEMRISSKKKFDKAFRGRFDTLIKKHTEKWHKLWDVADVEIEGTADIQKNLRFNIFHMLICVHEDDGFSSVGARTLSGEGYRGHIFWDAEIFLLPFYAHVIPKVAKNMLLYRYKRIKQARQIAKNNGYKGTMYPWESAGTGEEETPTWARNLDGSIIRIKTNKLEHHITADIAFACHQYMELTHDFEFMRDCGYEMIMEAARFWASRVQKNKAGKFEILDVIGPDEFHEHVNNNAYTNIMAKWNLITANRLYFQLKIKDPRTYRQLRSKINLTDKEVKHWRFIFPRIIFKKRRDKVIEEFDGFFKKRYIPIQKYDENGIPMLPKGVKVKDYGKTQFVKQADVLMFLYLLNNVFKRKTIERNYEFCVKRTLHKSSLSAPMHALSALQAGALNDAYRFFNVGLRADISNLHGNTNEGMHAASLGGVWQCVVNGFAGTRIRNNILCIHPLMPKTWRNIKFSMMWMTHLVKIEANNNEVRIKVEAKQKKRLKIVVFEKSHLIETQKAYTFKKQKMRKQEGYY